MPDPRWMWGTIAALTTAAVSLALALAAAAVRVTRRSRPPRKPSGNAIN